MQARRKFRKRLDFESLLYSLEILRMELEIESIQSPLNDLIFEKYTIEESKSSVKKTMKNRTTQKNRRT